MSENPTNTTNSTNPANPELSQQAVTKLISIAVDGLVKKRAQGRKNLEHKQVAEQAAMLYIQLGVFEFKGMKKIKDADLSRLLSKAVTQAEKQTLIKSLLDLGIYI